MQRQVKLNRSLLSQRQLAVVEAWRLRQWRGTGMRARAAVAATAAATATSCEGRAEHLDGGARAAAIAISGETDGGGQGGAFGSHEAAAACQGAAVATASAAAASGASAAVSGQCTRR